LGDRVTPLNGRIMKRMVEKDIVLVF
jgi:hypothetical protein